MRLLVIGGTPFIGRHLVEAALADGEWDATIDVCAYLPVQVRSLAAALGGRGGHHMLVSTVSVYAAPPGPGGDENSALLPNAVRPTQPWPELLEATAAEPRRPAYDTGR